MVNTSIARTSADCYQDVICTSSQAKKERLLASLRITRLFNDEV